jgi:3-hydroxybutyryl-CoA dehydrogenase
LKSGQRFLGIDKHQTPNPKQQTINPNPKSQIFNYPSYICIMIKTISVAGAGTMGSGIALCIAQHGINTILFDTNAAVVDKAKIAIQKNIDTLVQKNKISAEDGVHIQQKITYTTNINDCVADVIIEAIIEKMDAKVSLFTQIAAINPETTILASNTSSLSINELQQHIPHPERVAGLHFFNPAQIMKLVEVVQGKQTSSDTMDQLVSLCKHLNKTSVRCIDAPGFIVNRVARHYYLEAMRIAEHQQTPIADIDEILESAGFKMGPFKLMDLIGNDINLAVSQSLFDAYDGEKRFQPSPLQIDKVKQGNLGRKTGKGFYDYQ